MSAGSRGFGTERTMSQMQQPNPCSALKSLERKTDKIPNLTASVQTASEALVRRRSPSSSAASAVRNVGTVHCAGPRRLRSASAFTLVASFKGAAQSVAAADAVLRMSESACTFLQYISWRSRLFVWTRSSAHDTNSKRRSSLQLKRATTIQKAQQREPA